MKVIYIAGKYRGANAWAIEQNIRAAENVAARVWAAGHVALCPHANSRHMDGVASDEHFLAGTMELLRRCDAIVLINDWKNSSGAVAEATEANRLGLPILYAWGDETLFAETLHDLGRTPVGYRVPPNSQNPDFFDGSGFWQKGAYK